MLLIALIITADVLVTAALGRAAEANPLDAWAWDRVGLLPIVLLRCAAFVGLAIGALGVARRLPRLAALVLVVLACLLGLVVLLSLVNLFDRAAQMW